MSAPESVTFIQETNQSRSSVIGWLLAKLTESGAQIAKYIYPVMWKIIGQCLDDVRKLSSRPGVPVTSSGHVNLLTCICTSDFSADIIEVSVTSD